MRRGGVGEQGGYGGRWAGQIVRCRARGAAAEIRDAITLRAFLLVCGVGVLQLAFITSYIGAFHDPRPHQVPVSNPGASASRV